MFNSTWLIRFAPVISTVVVVHGTFLFLILKFNLYLSLRLLLLWFWEKLNNNHEQQRTDQLLYIFLKNVYSNGDSGGPIFQYNLANEPVLVGVASIAVLCSTTNIPTVYVRTSAHLDFLPKEAFNLTMVTNAAILPDANRTSPFGYEPIEAFNDTGSGWTRTATLLVATLVSGTVLVAIGVGLFLWIVLRRRKRLRKPAIPAAVVAPPPVAYATRANVEAGAENVSEIRTAAGGAGSGSASLTKSQTMETIGNL